MQSFHSEDAGWAPQRDEEGESLDLQIQYIENNSNLNLTKERI